MRLRALLFVAMAAWLRGGTDPLAGSVGLFRAMPGVKVETVLADTGGGVVAIGTTTIAKLPVTADAVQNDYVPSTCGTQMGPGFPNPIPCPNTYIARIGADGALRYGTYIGAVGGLSPAGAGFDGAGNLYVMLVAGSSTSVVRLGQSGARVVALPGEMHAVRLAVDRAGSLYVAATNEIESAVVKVAEGGTAWTAPLAGVARDIAVDASGRAVVCLKRDLAILHSNTAVVRLGADGSTAATAQFGGESADDPRYLAIAPDGSVLVAGTTISQQFPVTLGAAQTERIAETTGFVAKLAPELSGVVWATFLGGESWDWVTGLTALADGSAVVTGGTASRFYPVTRDALERCNRVPGYTQTAGFASHLSAAGDRLLYSSYVNLGEYASAVLGVAADADGRIVLIGESGADNSILRLDPESAPARQRFCVVNSASFTSGLVTPGEVVTLFGTGIGGGRVLANGVEAEILYAADDQINASLPQSDATGSIRIDLEVEGAIRESATLPAADSAPGLFRDIGYRTAAAVNEDGSKNMRERPAARGSLVTLFGTGFGTREKARIYFGPNEAEVVYQGPAAGAPAGVTAFQVRAPDGQTGEVAVNFSIGVSFVVANVRVWVQ